MKTETKPDLIQPDFLNYEHLLSVNVVILIAGLMLLVGYIIYKFVQIYPLLCIYLSIAETGLKKSAYQLSSEDIYKKIVKSNKISGHQLTVINNIKYQEKYKESAKDLKKAIYHIIVTLLIGKSDAI